VRILFVTNFFPPHDLGGWEQNCQEAVERFSQRGHTCQVLTSRYGTEDRSPAEAGVSRSLYLQADIHYYRPLDFFLRRAAQERANRALLSETVAAFQPDVVFIWGLWNLSRQVAYWAEQYLPGRVAYAIASYWLVEPDVHEAYWQQPARNLGARALMSPARRLASRRLAQEKTRYRLRLEHVACVSDFVRRKMTDAGALPCGARVIHNGIDPAPFCRSIARRDRDSDKLRLIYTGGILAHKGVHTAIEAFGLLKQRSAAQELQLSLVGAGHPDYEARLREIVTALGLNEQVTFVGRVPRAEIPGFLAAHDVFLFTSIWEEPIARAVMEAMAAGLAVIGTPVGGQPEVLAAGVNGLTFSPGDAESLAKRILQLRQEPALRVQLAAAGRATVLERFTLNRMVDEMEAWLKDIAG
jgi:glycogen synthase